MYARGQGKGRETTHEFIRVSHSSTVSEKRSPLNPPKATNVCPVATTPGYDRRKCMLGSRSCDRGGGGGGE